MDCEKFESLLIDELYGELDEVTSAAVRRHAAGCARCGALLSGLRATRKVAALPVEEPSSDLEDRILSAVREQQKVLPFRARLAVAVSRAGAWAMRPQTAMAAVFLVVIGTSFVLVESRKSAHMAAQTSAFSEGAPVQPGAAAPTATAAAASAFAFDEKETAFAHGVEEKRESTKPMPSVVSNGEAIADLEKDKREGEQTSVTRAAEIAKSDNLQMNAGPIAGAGGQGMLADDRTTLAGRGGGGGATATTTPAAPMAQAQTQQPYGSGGVSFGSAKQLYDQQRYDEAKAQWTALAPSDPNAALWAARAEKAKNGCGTAVTLFEGLRQRAPVGNEATLEAARCYRALGNSDAARARYASLANTQYAAAAQNELDSMSPVAARKSAPARVEMHASPPAATQQPAQAKPADKGANSY